jgi:hypothetical protein
MRKLPIIDCTDLYHPHQDPGDNFDLVAAYALPEIDLRAVVLDATEHFRWPAAEREKGGFPAGDIYGPREPGIIPVAQLNYLFDRNVPFGISPFHPMKSPEDRMEDAPAFQQSAIELVLRTLREAEARVDILIFCSCRTIAAAFNRDPELFRRKVGRIHLSAGTSSGERFDVDWNRCERLPLQPGSAGYLEWNVQLDPHAFVRLLASDLELAIYPCASDRGPFALDTHNTYYCCKNLSFVRRMDARLAAYLAYAFHRKTRNDFLRAVDEPVPEAELAAFDGMAHRVWETAVWQCAAGRRLVERPGVGFRLVRPEAVTADDRVLPSGLAGCEIEVEPTGRFTFRETGAATGRHIYRRGDPAENERAMAEAMGALYTSFAP